MLADRPLRLAAVLVAVLVAALALTACGEKQRIVPSDKATARAVASVPATVYPSPTKAAPTETPGATASATASPTSGGTAGGGDKVLASAANKFEPASLKVKVGTTVTWTAQGYHTVTSGTPEAADPNGPMKGPGGFQTYSVKFTKAGTYKYYCDPHKTVGMVGEIVVG